MATYNEHQQRELDISSGREIDRRSGTGGTELDRHVEYIGKDRIVVKDASRIVVGPPNRIGNSGQVVRHIVVYGEGGVILHEVAVLSRDGVLPATTST